MTGALELPAQHTVLLAELAVTGPSGERAPRVFLADASTPSPTSMRAADPREDDLRALARGTSDTCGAPYNSRSYCFPRALVASHTAPVGVDIERVQACGKAFADSIQTPSERAAGSPPGDPDYHFTSLWCSKEALSKALGDPLAYDPRRLEGPGAWREGRSGPWRACALDVGAGYLAWLCWHAG
jgi:4'-phosphopantetheinyl transferase superfamily